jgi:hypothetical protein
MQSVRRRVATTAALLLCAFAAAQAQKLSIPSGGTVQINGGRLALSGGDIRIDGRFALGSGELRGVGALRIGAGGTADFGSGVATLTGDWENRGIFNAGTSRVELRDGPVAVSSILGTNAFANLSLVSLTGKRYRFESAFTQRVAANLQIQGTGPAIQVDVTAPGSVAFLNLLPGGSQSIANVGVSDVHATGQPLAPTQTNQGGNGNDNGWFGGGGPVIPPTPVPAVGWPMLLLLGIGLFVIATRPRVRHAFVRG